MTSSWFMEKKRKKQKARQDEKTRNIETRLGIIATTLDGSGIYRSYISPIGKKAQHPRNRDYVMYLALDDLYQGLRQKKRKIPNRRT